MGTYTYQEFVDTFGGPPSRDDHSYAPDYVGAYDNDDGCGDVLMGTAPTPEERDQAERERRAELVDRFANDHEDEVTNVERP